MQSDYLKKPVLTKQIDTQKCGSFTYTTCQMQGWRKTMQDAILSLQIIPGVHLFAVFDGHGGPQVSHYVANILPKELQNEPYFKLGNYPKALYNLCARIDMMIDSKRGEDELEVICKRLVPDKFKKGEKISYRAGSTGIIMLMTKDRYYVANIGDSRAVLSRNGKAIPLSTDHKPQNPSQKNRIEKAGGFLLNNRVNGALSLSRAFGDFQYKGNEKLRWQQQMVTSYPEIMQLQRDQTDNFILIGCDGVWQKYVSNNQKMIGVVMGLRQKFGGGKVLMQKLFGELVAKEARELVGCDNMSCIFIDFM